MKFCLDAVRADLQQLKNHDDTLKLLDRARRKLARFRAEKVDREQLHRFIDDLQSQLNDISDSISRPFLAPASIIQTTLSRNE